MLTADIFRKIYDAGKLEPFILDCNEDFYSKLVYKAKVIRNIDNPLVDKKRLEHFCDTCGKPCEQLVPWKFRGQFFRANFYCAECDTTYAVGVRFKKLFDQVEYRKVVSVIESEPIIETGEDTE